MARGVRENLLTYSDQALKAIKWADDNLERMESTYAPVHPDYAQVCRLLREQLEMTAKVLLQFQVERM